MHHGRHRSPADRPMGFGPSQGGGPYNAEYNRSFHRRDPPRPYLQPPPPPPPSAAPVPSSRAEIFLEAGRLAVEYLVSKGLLSPNSLPPRGPRDLRGTDREEKTFSEARTSALARLGGPVPDPGPQPDRRRYGEDYGGSRNHYRGRRRSGPYRSHYGSDWGRENGRSQGFEDAMDGGDDFAPVRYRGDRRDGGGRYNESRGLRSAIESGPPSNSGSESENSEFADDSGSKTKSDVDLNKVEKSESAKAEMEEEKDVKGDELMGESGGIAEKEEEEEEVKDVVGSVSEEGGVSLLKLCGIAKVPTRARSSTVHKKSKSGQTVDEKDINSVEDPVEVSSSDPKTGVVNSMENVVSDTVLVIQQETKNQSSPVFGTSGEYVKPTDVESLEQCAIQNHGKEGPSDEHCHAIGVMQLSLTDEVMVDAEKPVDANESPRVETKDDSRMEEDKQQHMCASFKICDLNLMEGPEITEVPDNDPVVEDEKKALLDVGLSIGGNSSDNNGGNSGDKVIEVIDLEADDNPCDTSNEKGPLMYPSIESFLNNQVNPDGLPEIQDGYGLTIPEFLGNDTNCSSVQTDINNLQPGMILPGGQVFPMPNVIPNVDDSIYTSLGELPLNYMDMEVWDHPSLGYENNPSLEYEKFF